MILSPRLRWRLWKFRNHPVPGDGQPLTGTECYWLEVAAFALLDCEGTRRVALDEAAAEMHAAGGNEGERR